MKKRDFERLTPLEKKALRDLAKEQPEAMLKVRRSEQKGYTDLPLFKEDNQTSLF